MFNDMVKQYPCHLKYKEDFDYATIEKYVTCLKEKLREYVNECPISFDRYYTEYFHPGSIRFIDGLTLYVLIRANKPESILEIGSFTGASLKFMLAASLYTYSKITSVDIWPPGKIINPLILIGRGDLLTAEEKTQIIHVTENGVKFVQNTTDKFDLIFEDSDHTYNTTYNIIKNIARISKDGCIMVNHDAGMSPIQRAFADLDLHPDWINNELAIMKIHG